MTEDQNQDRAQADRLAVGTGEAANDEEGDSMESLPGVTRGGARILPDVGATSDASLAEGTIGAIGEMDFTGAPAGTSGAGGLSGASSAGDTQGGASAGAGGQINGGGSGPGTSVDDSEPQSPQNTLAVLGDNEQSTITQ